MTKTQTASVKEWWDRARNRTNSSNSHSSPISPCRAINADCLVHVQGKLTDIDSLDGMLRVCTDFFITADHVQLLSEETIDVDNDGYQTPKGLSPCFGRNSDFVSSLSSSSLESMEEDNLIDLDSFCDFLGPDDESDSNSVLKRGCDSESSESETERDIKRPRESSTDEELVALFELCSNISGEVHYIPVASNSCNIANKPMFFI